MDLPALKKVLFGPIRDKKFDEIIQQCHKRNGDIDVTQLLLSLSSKEGETLANQLAGFTRWCLKKLEIVDDEEEEASDASVGEVDIELDESAEAFVSRLRGVTAIAQAFVTDCADSKPKSLLSVIELLHEALIPLDEAVHGVVSLKSSIAKICEFWWVHNEPGAENLIPQLLPYLLICSLNPDSCDVDVKRVYGIRLCLLLLDFDDESIDSVKSLLLRCVGHPTYLKLSEGKKFLAFLFSISKSKRAFIACDCMFHSNGYCMVGQVSMNSSLKQ
jgi:hypothetical protein